LDVIESRKVYPPPDKVKTAFNLARAKLIKRVFLDSPIIFSENLSSLTRLKQSLLVICLRKKIHSSLPKEKESFDQLKLDLSRGPVLKIFNPKSEIELHTDV